MQLQMNIIKKLLLFLTVLPVLSIAQEPYLINKTLLKNIPAPVHEKPLIHQRTSRSLTEIAADENPVIISGDVFLDENFNGIRDIFESGIEGANVVVRGPEGFYFNVLTGADGYFSTTGPAGFYDEIGVGAPQDCQTYCRDGSGNYIGLGYTFEVTDDVNLRFAFEPGKDIDGDRSCDPEDYTLTHSHQNEQHPYFGQPREIKSQGVILDDPPPFISVCADGTAVSLVELTNHTGCDYDFFYLSVKIAEDLSGTVPDQFGTVEVLQQEKEVFKFRYRHPVFLPSEYANQKYAEYTLELRYNDGSGEEVFGEIKVKVWHPPVVMVHGLWSDRNAFDKMSYQLLSTSRYDPVQLFRANYKDTNDASFYENVSVIPESIDQTIQNMLEVGRAAGAVDVVCHSMGGILTRLYLQGAFTHPYANDIHKLITCNTPHSGAQPANFLLEQPVAVIDALGCGFIIKKALGNCYNGAISDLRVDSDAIESLNAPGRNEATVPSHAVVTYSNVSELINIPEETIDVLDPIADVIRSIPLAVKHPVVNFFTGLITTLDYANSFTNALFNYDDHDIVVADASQRGGLASSYISPIEDQMHVGSVANGQVIGRVQELLAAKPDAGEFTLNGFSPPTLTYTNPNLLASQSATRSDLAIQILSPLMGDTLHVGDTLIVEANGNESVTNVICLLEFKLDTVYRAEVDSSYAQFAFIVDSTAIGKRNFLVSGFNAQTGEVAIDTSYFFIQPEMEIDSISAYPETLEVEIGQNRSLEIFGYYSGSNTPVNISSLPDLQFDFRQGKAVKVGSNGVMGLIGGADSLYIAYEQATSEAIPIRVASSSNIEDLLEQASFTFDGIDDLIVGPSHPSLELIDGTVELWVKPQQKASSQTFICYRDNTGGQTRYLWNFLGGLSGLGFWNGASYTTLAHSFSPDTWVHLAFVDDGTETKAYVDGNLIGAFPAQFGSVTGSDLHLVMGYDIPGSEFFSGQIDEVRIWQFPKTAAQIENQRLCVLSGADSCLVAYYNFQTGVASGNEPDAYILNDLSGNGLDATFQNLTLDENALSWLEEGISSGEDCPVDSSASCEPPLFTHSVQTYYLITSDYNYVPDEYNRIIEAMQDIQAWYQIATGGETFYLHTPDSAIVLNLPNTSTYYEEDYWGRILTDLGNMGLSTFEPGKVNLFFIKGGGGVALGAQACGKDCGAAMFGMDIFPEFNTGQFFDCPDVEGGARAWPCTPLGAAAHELGHCFGLPHPIDVPATMTDAGHSLMQTHWNYPYIYAPPAESPWNLLTLERRTLWDNPFFYQEVPIVQPYEEMPPTNLPVNGALPAADFSYSVSGKTLTFSNLSTGDTLTLWTFGDGATSNERNPVHTYDDYGSFTVRLRASGTGAMISLAEQTLQLEPTADCPDSLLVNNNPIPADTFQAGQYLASSAQVLAGDSVYFKAGAKVVLHPGFRANSGSYFSAVIGDCMPMQSEVSDQSPEESVALRTNNDPQNIIDNGDAFDHVDLKIYPNPNNGQGVIDLVLPQSEEVSFYVFDLYGREVTTILSPQMREKGRLMISFELPTVAPGIYVVVGKIGHRQLLKRMVITRP